MNIICKTQFEEDLVNFLERLTEENSWSNPLSIEEMIAHIDSVIENL